MPRLLAFIEEGFEAGVAGAADRQARAVGEDRQATILAVRLYTYHTFQINDVRPMDADKIVRIEACFQAGNSLLLEVLFSLTDQGHIVVLSLGVVELANRN